MSTANLFGLNTGLAADFTFADISFDSSLNDIIEALTEGNLVVGLTQTQINAVFGVSAEDGVLTYDTLSLQRVIADVINDTDSYSVRVTNLDNISGFDISTYNVDLSNLDVSMSAYSIDAIYNARDIVRKVRDHLRPTTHINTLKNRFISASLGTTEATIGNERLNTLRTEYTGLGFFTDLSNSLETYHISGDAGYGVSPTDISVGGSFDGSENLFKAIADAGYLSTSATGADLSLEDGFAFVMNLNLKGRSTMTIRYNVDTAFTGAGGESGSENLRTSGGNDFTGILSGTVLQTLTKKVSDAEVGVPIVGTTTGYGGDNDVRTFPLLLMKVAEAGTY